MAKRSVRRARTRTKISTNNHHHQPSLIPLGIAFDHFNQELFNGILKRPVLKVKGLKSSLGYFAFDGCRDTTEDTICIDLHHFKEHSQAKVLSTLVHEMCHQWQSNHGKMGRRSGYHNLQWAGKMEECGLMASTTGKEGGKKNGPRVSHYIIAGGVFEQSCSRLPSDFVLCQPQPPILVKAKTRVKAKTKTVTRPQVKKPSPVAPVSTRPPKKRRRRYKKPLTFLQKISLAIKRLFQVTLAIPAFTVLIVIVFLLVAA